MPLYPYSCSRCGHDEELLLSVKAFCGMRQCPECGHRTFRRGMPTRIALRTETAFLAGRKMFGDQFQTEEHRDRVVKAARANGHEPHANEHYQMGLARFCGDPEAFVPHDHSRAYMTTMLKSRGQACPDLGIKKGMSREEPPTRLSPAIVNEHLHSRITDDPDLARKPDKLREVEHEIVNVHGSDPE